MLSHYAGLRVGEIAALTWDQLVDANGDVRDQFYLEAQTTKSNEARTICHFHIFRLMCENIA